jgi:hypothetical protein
MVIENCENATHLFNAADVGPLPRGVLFDSGKKGAKNWGIKARDRISFDDSVIIESS